METIIKSLVFGIVFGLTYGLSTKIIHYIKIELLPLSVVSQL